MSDREPAPQDPADESPEQAAKTHTGMPTGEEADAPGVSALDGADSGDAVEPNEPA